MKNLKVLFFTSLFIVISITTASTKNVEIVSKKYPVKSFSYIHANTVADIVYTQSDAFSVIVDGEKELLDHLIIKVEDGVLSITGDEELNSKNDISLVVFINSPNLTSIETYGKGDLCLKGEVKSDHLIIKSFGIGRVHALNLQCENLCVEYEAIGSMKLGGTTQQVVIFSSGIGNIYCENLLAKNAVVRSTRIGKVNCFASEGISLLNDGIGEITYHGNPSFKNLQNKGMGEINKGL